MAPTIFDRVFRSHDRVRTAIQATSAAGTKGGGRGILSPWDPHTLQSLVWYDVFGTETLGVSRSEAMSIPAVSKARSVILSLVADAPLVALRGDTPVTPQPSWTSRTPGILGPWQRLAWSLDDLMFYGWSLWATKRNDRGEILDAERIPQEWWMFDSENRVTVISEGGSYEPVDESEVILIPGPAAGLLDTFGRTLRGAAAIEAGWVDRALHPLPAIDLHETQESSIDADEAQEVVDAWAAARSDSRGSIAFTPSTIEARALGQFSPDMFSEARNALRLDVANFFALPASLLEGSVSTASLTYSTQEGHQNEVFLYSLPYWVRPIEDRLSQDDVVPRGQSVHLDFTEKLAIPQPPIRTTED